MPRAAKKAPVEDITEERHQAQQSFASAQADQRKEQHYWITFHQMGEQDQQAQVDLHPNGVTYVIRKGEKVPLPQSAINALEMAQRVGLDHGHPIEHNGKKFLRKIVQSDYGYTIHGQCSPEEAAEWRDAAKRAAAAHSDIVQVGGPPDEDMVEVGSA